MPQSIAERKDRFSRIFPDRVEKIVDQFRLISQCSSPKSYEFNRDTVAKVWTHILDAMMQSADKYGLEIAFTVNGKSLSEVSECGSIESLFEPAPVGSKAQESLF